MFHRLFITTRAILMRRLIMPMVTSMCRIIFRQLFIMCQLMIVMAMVEATLTPVSYTHLDVYKRQWETIESQIAEIEERISQIDTEMNENGSNTELLLDLQKELDNKTKELEEKYERCV